MPCEPSPANLCCSSHSVAPNSTAHARAHSVPDRIAPLRRLLNSDVGPLGKTRISTVKGLVTQITNATANYFEYPMTNIGEVTIEDEVQLQISYWNGSKISYTLTKDNPAGPFARFPQGSPEQVGAWVEVPLGPAQGRAGGERGVWQPYRLAWRRRLVFCSHLLHASTHFETQTTISRSHVTHPPNSITDALRPTLSHSGRL